MAVGGGGPCADGAPDLPAGSVNRPAVAAPALRPPPSKPSWTAVAWSEGLRPGPWPSPTSVATAMALGGIRKQTAAAAATWGLARRSPGCWPLMVKPPKAEGREASAPATAVPPRPAPLKAAVIRPAEPRPLNRTALPRPGGPPQAAETTPGQAAAAAVARIADGIDIEQLARQIGDRVAATAATQAQQALSAVIGDALADLSAAFDDLAEQIADEAVERVIDQVNEVIPDQRSGWGGY